MHIPNMYINSIIELSNQVNIYSNVVNQYQKEMFSMTFVASYCRTLSIHLFWDQILCEFNGILFLKKKKMHNGRRIKIFCIRLLFCYGSKIATTSIICDFLGLIGVRWININNYPIVWRVLCLFKNQFIASMIYCFLSKNIWFLKSSVK